MKSQHIATLFDLPVSPARGITWRRHPNLSFANYQMLFDGEPNGTWVRHCGHPTANRPYYVITPDHIILDRKFSRLDLAKLAAVMVIEDRYTDDAWIAEASQFKIL